MCRYIASASARGRELSGRVLQTRIISPYYALDQRPAPSVYVMAGLNVSGLQSKLLITPLSSEAIIMKSTEVLQTLGTI